MVITGEQQQHSGQTSTHMFMHLVGSLHHHFNLNFSLHSTSFPPLPSLLPPLHVPLPALLLVSSFLITNTCTSPGLIRG
ncbi:hypothetical protein Pcinc_017203 [Petrolisthes cinctipes]|uniref:Uncharacterized protein n=1 Tax=Petrolisthes cinctipes TaxID=88211 RepID=A0AAE1FPK5_PETCI|nr:hypothetical protein Pcinc_017203 [Petrolisthes cinctipes]